MTVPTISFDQATAYHMRRLREELDYAVAVRRRVGRVQYARFLGGPRELAPHAPKDFYLLTCAVLAANDPRRRP